jgi:hypothetical protein
VRSVRRLVAALLAPALLGGAGSAVVVLLGPAAPASAAAKPCVGVVVDGRLAGGTVRTGCATGDPGSGLEALTRAGFSYAFVPRQPGEVCQIDGLPECSRTSTQTYWSYWWRAAGSTRWVYASEGAGTHDPKPGSTEGWVWQDGGRRQPPAIAFSTVCPQAARTSAPPTKTATSAPARTSSTPHATSPPSASATATVTATRTRTATPSPTPTASTPTTSASTAAIVPSSSSPSTTGVAAPAGDGGGGPPWVGLVAGAALVGVLGSAAVARSRRTRSSP